MDSRMAYIENLMKSDVVGFHIFTLKYNKDNENVYYFLEGEDEKYYKPRVEAISGKKSIFIDCKGREGVVEAVRLVKSKEEYNNDAIIGFIDRDYYLIDYSEQILVTDYYSIESYYCREESILAILSSHCKLDSDLQLLIETNNEFKRLYDLFVQEMIFFSIWCLLQINHTQLEKKKFTECKKNQFEQFTPENFISLSKFNLMNNIEVSFTNVIATNLKSVESIMSLCPKAFKKAKLISDKEVNDYLRKIDRDQYKYYIRGKYELEFLITFLRLKIPQLNNLHRKKISQSLEEPLLLFSSYAETSSSLREHIDKNLKTVLKTS